MESIKKNILLNGVKIFFNLLFPLVTLPYISRIFGPTGIGKITFINSIINYLLLFTNLGIPLYGIREIAKRRENKLALSKVFSEILFLNLITTIVGMIIFILLLKINLLGDDKKLFFIMSLNIIFTFLGVEWYFQGIENYLYITKRSIIFKIISIILMFLFVKKETDILNYIMILIFSQVGSNILNFFKAKKEIKISFKNLMLRRHLKPILIIFSMSVTTSIYTNLNSVMLGYYSTEYSLGIYSVASKIIYLILGVITSMGVVIIPRIANFIVKRREEELKNLMENILSLLLAITIPSVIGLNFIADEIIWLFSGNNFIEAIKTIKILSIVIFFIVFSNFLGMQILYPRGKEKEVLFSVIVGAIANFSLNYFLISKYMQNGVAISTVIAEGLVLLIQIFLGYKYLNFKVINFNNFKYILASIFMLIGLILIKFYLKCNTIYYSLLIKLGVGLFIYFLSLIVLKEKLILKKIKNLLS